MKEGYAESFPPNPQAFPVDDFIRHGIGHKGQSGMSLRDYFAGQAMQGRLANPHYAKNMEDTDVPSERVPNDIAYWSYRMADAMLAERSK